ncbi:MAG: YybS family protein [Gammaproteobacteria bacterium]|nr:YybS family protein [Gammaproteobacteria bacterium]
MRALATYIMRGQMQAITTVAACAVLALVAMPLSWPVGYLSAAGIGLVTLVHGAREGGKTLLGAAAILALIGMVIIGSPLLAIGFALTLWLPALVLAAILLSSRTLVFPVQVLLVFGLAIVAGAYALMGDPAIWWYNHIVNDVMPTLEQANIGFQRGPEFETRLANATKLMTGVLVMVTALGMLAGLLIARWWQAVLYKPGAFGEEFRSFRLGKVIGIVAVVIVLLAIIGSGKLAELASNFLLVMMGILLIQGLALAHALVARFKAHQLWLAMLYMLLVLAMPYMLVMLAMAGLVDNWADFRKRFQARPETEQD